VPGRGAAFVIENFEEFPVYGERMPVDRRQERIIERHGA
jgi:hypothetical protein